ncbi:hypothetical protein [Helicobacter typhlonius]|uniref:hypothetical protein n=1 Tax=Helicobacter typhlonius TaxID=76936 RepID=UPI002FE1C4AA
MRETNCKGLIFEPLTLKEFLASCNKDYLESSLSNSQKSDFKQKVVQYLESYEQNKGHNESAIVAFFKRVRIPRSTSLQTARQ